MIMFWSSDFCRITWSEWGKVRARFAYWAIWCISQYCSSQPPWQCPQGLTIVRRAYQSYKNWHHEWFLLFAVRSIAGYQHHSQQPNNCLLCWLLLPQPQSLYPVHFDGACLPLPQECSAVAVPCMQYHLQLNCVVPPPANLYLLSPKNVQCKRHWRLWGWRSLRWGWAKILTFGNSAQRETLCKGISQDNHLPTPRLALSWSVCSTCCLTFSTREWCQHWASWASGVLPGCKQAFFDGFDIALKMRV